MLYSQHTLLVRKSVYLESQNNRISGWKGPQGSSAPTVLGKNMVQTRWPSTLSSCMLKCLMLGSDSLCDVCRGQFYFRAFIAGYKTFTWKDGCLDSDRPESGCIVLVSLLLFAALLNNQIESNMIVHVSGHQSVSCHNTSKGGLEVSHTGTFCGRSSELM